MNTFWIILLIFAGILLVLLFACILAGANDRYPENEELSINEI